MIAAGLFLVLFSNLSYAEEAIARVTKMRGDVKLKKAHGSDFFCSKARRTCVFW